MAQRLIASEEADNAYAIVTKPPETIFMHFNNRGKLILFDAHWRQDLNGSHFLIFDDEFNAEKYLKTWWPFQDLSVGFDDLFAQQINLCEISFFKLKQNANPSQQSDLEKMKIELQNISKTMERQWNRSYGQKQ